MVMVPGTAEQRLQAWAAAVQFCAGTEASVETLTLVADVGLLYALQGSDAAVQRARTERPASLPEQQGASPAPPSSDGTGSDWQASAAQELANEAYRAPSRTFLTGIGKRAEMGGLMDKVVEMEGESSTLRAYLQIRWTRMTNPDLGL
jgi:hypothetical protein